MINTILDICYITAILLIIVFFSGFIFTLIFTAIAIITKYIDQDNTVLPTEMVLKALLPDHLRNVDYHITPSELRDCVDDTAKLDPESKIEVSESYTDCGPFFIYIKIETGNLVCVEFDEAMIINTYHLDIYECIGKL